MMKHVDWGVDECILPLLNETREAVVLTTPVRVEWPSIAYVGPLADQTNLLSIFTWFIHARRPVVYISLLFSCPCRPCVR